MNTQIYLDIKVPYLQDAFAFLSWAENNVNLLQLDLVERCKGTSLVSVMTLIEVVFGGFLESL